MSSIVNIIIDRFSKSKASYLKIGLNDYEILEVEKKKSSVEVKSSEKIANNLHGNETIEEILSEYVGKFHFKENQELVVGSKITNTFELGSIKAIGVQHDIKSQMKKAVVKEILVQEGDVVEYGQILFRLGEDS